MKASQVIARIEAAGWKKIRSEGSHAVFEHPKYGRRSTAFGRPQRDVNKRRLLEVIEDFHLDEIEQAKLDARLQEAKRRPEPARAALARVVPEPELRPLGALRVTGSEMSDQDIRILWAQLHKEHGYTTLKLGQNLRIASASLVDFLHHGKPLGPSDRAAVVAYMADRERALKLTRNRAELLKKGYGARTGSSNSVDPFIAVAREAILKTLDAGVAGTELAHTIGIRASVIYVIKSGKSKTIYPAIKAKLQKWYDENWTEPEMTDYKIAEAGDESMTAREGDVIDPVSGKVVVGIDDELAAIQIVLNAVKPLGPSTAKRALRYVLDRMDG